MSTITIYATAKHKQKENVGCSAYHVFNEKTKKSTEKVNQFVSEGKIFTQLSTLIQSISSVKKEKDVDEVKLYTDFSLIQDFLNGSVMDWERNNWARESGRAIPHADLWKELSDLCEKYNVQLNATEVTDNKMADLSKKVQNESKNAKKSTAKTGKQVKEKAVVKEVSAPHVVEEKTEPVKETPKKSTAKKEKVAPKTPPKEEVPVPTPVPVPAPIEASTEPKKVVTSTETSVKIDADLLKESETLFKEIGLDTQTAITMFLKDSLRKQGLTLDLKL